MGAKIRDIQQMHDGTDRIFKRCKKSKYEYKTDIPNFIDRLRLLKINKCMANQQVILMSG